MEKGPSTYAEYWTSPYNEVEHYKHAKEFGVGGYEYSRKAVNFAKNKERGTRAFRSYDGSEYRYKPSTNEFMIISKYGKIVTFYKPTNPKNFIDNKFFECGEYWLN